MGEEFYRLLDVVIIDDTNLFNNKLQEWQDYYNYHRPQAGLAGQTPYERLKEKAKSTNPDTVVKDVRQLHLVREAGLEPARPKTQVPKTCVSAISPLPQTRTNAFPRPYG